jgi:2-polyprenyl-3-methyl-5-hydroxy-6-metoxy-1,4-benzoquinol methylase
MLSREKSSYDQKDLQYFANARTEVLPLLKRDIASIIDIGGGSGSTLTLIRRHLPLVRTVCVDGHAPSLAIATKNGHIALECDLDSEIPEAITDCDVVLCLDVLEHLVDPWTVLRRISDKMKPGSDIIVSLPNVRYLPVSAGLLFGGSWELTDAGILDRTHLRFFTRRSALALFKGAGFNLQKLVSKIGWGPKAALGNTLTLGVFRDILTVQYLLVGSKPADHPAG